MEEESKHQSVVEYQKDETVPDNEDGASTSHTQHSPHSGLKTADFYKMHENVPHRFNKPGM